MGRFCIPFPPLTVPAVARVLIIIAQYASDVGIVGTRSEVVLSGVIQIVCPRTGWVTTISGRAGAFEVM